MRQNVVQWVETIRKSPSLDAFTEERLIGVLSQLIEQKFKTLTYKELSQMLRLTPFREMESVKEVVQEEHVEILTRLIQKRFTLSTEMTAALNTDLQQLDLPTLRSLVDLIFDFQSFEQLETWIADHLPRQHA